MISGKEKKRQLENLLRKHGYIQDERPDHREWTKQSNRMEWLSGTNYYLHALECTQKAFGFAA